MKLTFPLGNIFHRLRKKVWIRLPPLLLPRPQMAWGRRRSLASWTPHCQVRSLCSKLPSAVPCLPKTRGHLLPSLLLPAAFPVPPRPHSDHASCTPSPQKRPCCVWTFLLCTTKKEKKHFELNYDTLNYMEKMCCSETIKSRTIWHRWLCNYPHVALFICIWNSPPKTKNTVGCVFRFF